MLSIIVPTYNRKETIQETLRHLAQIGELSNYIHEIIVVNDGEVELSELENSYQGLNVRVVKNKGKGAAAARNFGAALAIYDLLLFIDDDMLLNENAIPQIIEFHKDKSNCMMSGSREYSPEILEKMSRHSFGRFMVSDGDSGMGGAELKQVGENLYECKTLASFCLSMLKGTFDRLNGFNEKFLYAGCEDQEFTMRALELDIKLYYLTSIKTFHNDLQTGLRDKWLSRQFTGVQGFPLLCELYPARKSSLLFRENYPVTSEDDLKLKIKKVFKKVAYGKSGFYVLKNLTGFLEKFSATEAVLNRCYSLMGGMMIYQGFQIGRKKLPNDQKTAKQNPKNEFA